ncbi:MAG: hypothetical protein JSR32_07005 [Proteobacteria bacterium]|nr:hypothetical protein [Pseudomonadota bacterium]
MKKSQQPKIGLDSQCLSYLLDAIEGIEEPLDSLAEEKKALIRIWFYPPVTYYVTETVISEVKAIKVKERQDFHKNFIDVLFLDFAVCNPVTANNRADALSAFHSGKNDCRILAEAEDQELDFLLTYDTKFLKHLSLESKSVRVTQPSLYWTNLQIPKGAEPQTVPHPSNPLSNQKWWRW